MMIKETIQSISCIICSWFAARRLVLTTFKTPENEKLLIVFCLCFSARVESKSACGMYRAGLVCTHKDIIKEVNKILFNFIWKGKDEVKRSVLISDEENGGLRAPHLESIIRTQRIMYCKKFAEAQQSSWKIILSHYLKQVGGKLRFWFVDLTLKNFLLNYLVFSSCNFS